MDICLLSKHVFGLSDRNDCVCVGMSGVCLYVFQVRGLNFDICCFYFGCMSVCFNSSSWTEFRYICFYFGCIFVCFEVRGLKFVIFVFILVLCCLLCLIVKLEWKYFLFIWIIVYII